MALNLDFIELNQDLIDNLIELYQLNDRLRRIREALNAQIDFMNESNLSERTMRLMRAQYISLKAQETSIKAQKHALILEIQY